MMNLTETIKNSLPAGLGADAHLLVALSGGADSVALLLALHELGYRVEALHCNFELRGTESDADEAFCRRLCRQAGIPLHVKHFRTKSYAQRHTISLEMAARQLRYEWFGQQASALAAEAICVAHHRDDNIETMVLNLVRGTGIHGITGMSPRSEQGSLVILRPMLSVSRQEIEAWLEARGQTWVTDSTNLQSDAALRNMVRLRLLPLLEEMNPRVRETLAADIQRFREAEVLYDKAVGELLEQVKNADGNVDIERLKAAESPRTLLQEWLQPYGFNSSQISDIYNGVNGESGKVWQSPTHRLLRDRGRLVLEPHEGGSEEVVLPLEGFFEASPEVRLIIRRQPVDAASFAISRDMRTACFDLEKLELPLTIRRVHEGDRLQPFGMNGTRLVSDVLTDRKLSLFEKERQMVVLSGDRIVWVVGLRVAAGAEIDDSTRHAMTLTLL